MAAMIMAIVVGSQLRFEKPNTVPAAGGCSVSVAAIIRIKTPTEMARLKSLIRILPSRKSATGAANKIRARADPTNMARPTNQRSCLGSMVGGVDEFDKHAGTQAGVIHAFPAPLMPPGNPSP